MGHDYQPYRLRRGDRFPDDGPAEWGEPTALVELPWSWTLDDYVYLEFVDVPAHAHAGSAPTG